MSGVEFRFLEPVDVLSLRGNKNYGEAGSYGDSMMPPWPSVIAGALRSRILVDSGIDPAEFAAGAASHPSLGTPQQPGSFLIAVFQLARRLSGGRFEILVAPPADLVIGESECADEDGRRRPSAVYISRPVDLGPLGLGSLSSYPLTLLPVLAEKERSKPSSGYWLTERGWRAYLAGRRPDAADLVHRTTLWRREARVGVGLSPETRSAEESRLFTAEVISPRFRIHAGAGEQGYDLGFIVGVRGGSAPDKGLLRVGGDGRAIRIWGAPGYRLPEPDYAAVARAQRCRLILATPGIFPGGWLPAGFEAVADQRFEFSLHGVRGRLVAACIGRAQVISGWDLALERPKAAQRAVPAGSVYWLDQVDATAEALQRLAAEGLWAEPQIDPQRRAEGFNQVWVAEWTKESSGVGNV
jgi:CRISPR-associated protein Cmr3